MTVIEPVDIADQVMSLSAEANWLDVQVCEPLVLRVANQVLGFKRHKLWVEPRPKKLTVEALPPLIVGVLISVLHFYQVRVRLDLRNRKEHLVDLLIRVHMRTA